MEKSAWQQLEDEGYDMSLIEANLSVSVRQRLEWGDAARQLGLALRQANDHRLKNEPDRATRAIG